MERVLEIGDRGAGTPAMKNELSILGETGTRVDLGAEWSRLGIRVQAIGRDPLQLDDQAPEASLRTRVATGN